MVKVLGISLAESVAELGCLAPYLCATATDTITASCSKRDELPMAVSTFTHTSLCNGSWRCSWNNTLIAARAKIASCRPCRRRNLLAGQGPRPQSQEKIVINNCKGCSRMCISGGQPFIILMTMHDCERKHVIHAMSLCLLIIATVKHESWATDHGSDS